MFLSFGRKRDASGGSLSPAQHWDHDRRVISSWLLRESNGHFDGAELRSDGSSYIAFNGGAGRISVHDYWSFARFDYDASRRSQSYATILGRQVPILTLGYTRPGTPPVPAETVIFLCGELVVDQGNAAVFGPLSKGKSRGELVAIESTRNPPEMKPVNLYEDPFLTSVVATILDQAHKLPGH